MHIADYIAVLKRIKFLEWATATAVSLATLIVVTVILWWVKLALPGAISHPVFFYLVPTALLAMFYGIIEGALFAVAAFICSAFLLYDPIYSFRVSDERALGELFWFLMTAVVGVKCVAEIHRHSDKS